MDKTRKRPARGAGKTRQTGRPAPAPDSYAGMLKRIVDASSGSIRHAGDESAPLAHLEYRRECELKEEGLRVFWQRYELPGTVEDLVPSPLPRAYRTTSKRRTVFHRKALYLLLGEAPPRIQKRAFVESSLEPPEHGLLYRLLQQKLSEAFFAPAARHLNYLIIRGTYAERAVIFNVDEMNGFLIRKFKILAGHLERSPELVNAAFVYCDPTHSEYYLESRRPAGAVNFKNLFGRDRLAVAHCGRRYLFHPTSFSQVNESMVSAMLERARELLAPVPGERLLDLYCGYGLFSHFLAPDVRQVLGVDAEGPSIRAAEDNRRLNPGSTNTRFLARTISGEGLEEMLPSSAAQESVILDPPRQGPKAGVIAALAGRRPRGVLHIFCGVDQIPASLRQWEAGGYGVIRVVPLDMFPGTANLEVLVLLRPVD